MKDPGKPQTPAKLRAWLRAEIASRRRWCGFRWRSPAFLALLEAMERGRGRRRR